MQSPAETETYLSSVQSDQRLVVFHEILSRATRLFFNKLFELTCEVLLASGGWVVPINVWWWKPDLLRRRRAETSRFTSQFPRAVSISWPVARKHADTVWQSHWCRPELAVSVSCVQTAASSPFQGIDRGLEQFTVTHCNNVLTVECDHFVLQNASCEMYPKRFIVLHHSPFHIPMVVAAVQPDFWVTFEWLQRDNTTEKLDVWREHRIACGLQNTLLLRGELKCFYWGFPQMSELLSFII